MSAADSGHAFLAVHPSWAATMRHVLSKSVLCWGSRKMAATCFCAPRCQEWHCGPADVMTDAGTRIPVCHSRGWGFARPVYRRLSPISRRLAADRPPIAADRMAAIRALFDEHEEISASLVVGALGLSVRRVREILQQLTDAGVLMKQSDRRNARYMLTPRQKRQSD